VPENSEGSQVNEHAIRRFLYQALSSFKELKDVTILYVSQKDDGIVSSLSQYLCDGLLNIEYESMGGEYSRHLVIRKMRQTKHNEDLHPIEISKKGVIVHKIE
jgi:KaiC/GvpD/RAD55 family RecA-like ATPase